MILFEEWALNESHLNEIMGGTGPAPPETPGDLDDPPPA